MRLNPAALLCLALTLASPTLALDLDGGTETFTVPEDIGNGKISISLTNKTGALICDFVIRVSEAAAEAPPFNISRAYVNDPNQGGETWLVDDNNNGELDAGEGDNQPPAPGERVRIQEEGENQCVDRNRTVSLELEFDQNPRQGDKLKISPTSENGGVIFVSSLPGCASVENANLVVPAGHAVLRNGTGELVTSFPVTTQSGVELVAASSPSHGGYFDFYSQTYYLDEPFDGNAALELQYRLSDFNPDGAYTTVCFGKTVAPVPYPDAELEKPR